MILRVLDTETSGLDPEVSNLLEVAFCDLHEGTPVYEFQSMIWSGNKIPALAKSIHHIQEEDVIDAMPLKALEHIIYSEDVIPVAHNAEFDSKFLPGFSREWLCTLLLSKQAWPGLESYTNQYLRYHLELNIDTKDTHSALPDVRVTVAILQELLKHFKGNTYFELLEIQEKSYEIMPFGKHKGENFSDIPSGYLKWVLNNTEISDKYKQKLRSVLK